MYSPFTYRLESIKDAVSLSSRIIGQFTSEQQIHKLESFVKSKEIEHGAFPKVHESIENARKDLIWAEKNIPEIKAYLAPKSSSPSSASSIAGFTIFVAIAALANIFML